MYRNPIIPGFSPDPSIAFHNGIYYLATSTFEYFPGVTIHSSKDLVNWDYHSSVLTSTDQLDLSLAKCSSGLYAATIRVNGDGRFYMVTTSKYTHKNFICHTDDIDSNWSEISFICEDGIDPSLFFLSDGRCFYTSNGTVNGVRGIKGAFINPDNGKLLEDFRLISTGCGGPASEGPHIYFKDGWYYLMLAEGGTGYGHHESILRARNIYGPYEQNPGNPILSHVRRKGHEIQATGHADLFETPSGEWYSVFLGIRVKPRPLLHHLGRETFLAKVTWQNGWPCIGDHGRIEIEMPSEVQQKQLEDYSVDFSEDYHRYPYLKVRVPNEQNYLQDRKNKTLTLLGKDNINTPLGHPTLIGFRQQGFFDQMDVTVKKVEKLAGISSFLSEDYHYRLEIDASMKAVKLIRHLHDFEAVTEIVEVSTTDPIKLGIRSTDEFYTFHVNGIELGRATVYGLAAEGTMYNTFTGVLFAIYAAEGKATFTDGISMKHL